MFRFVKVKPVSIIKEILSFIFQSYSCDLYEQEPVKRNEAEFLPGIHDLSFIMVNDLQQLEDLNTAGFDLLNFRIETRNMLEKGAAVGLIFIGKELASMEWVAMNVQANRAINIYPLKIDFYRKEAYASGVWTNPKFRRKGLHTYVYYKAYDFLRKNGVKLVRSIVATDNIAAQKAHQRFFPEEKIYGRARYLKILGFQFWHEERLGNQRGAEEFDLLPLPVVSGSKRTNYND
jgi:ribosomal protein S18 acetylase RimI-like enzyme